MGDKPRAELFSALASLYRTRDYSDLVLFAKDGSRHPVHRCIICPRSKFFYTIVKEGRWRERNEGHIALNDEEPEVVRLLVEYLYLLDYDPLSAHFSTTDDNASSYGDFSDTMSVRTEPIQYGHVYGTSAVSAFGGPVGSPPLNAATVTSPSSHRHSSSQQQQHQHQQQQSPLSPQQTQSSMSASFRPRAESALTMHAIPSGGAAPDFTAAESFHGGGPSHTGVVNARGGLMMGGNNGKRRQTTNPTTTATTNSRGTMMMMMVNKAPEPSPLAGSEPNLLLHSRIYGAAVRFGIEGLKVLALDKFKIQLTRHWDSAEFPEAIHVVYSSTPASDKDMREAVADTLGWHSRLLDKPAIEVAIMDINGLAYELLKRSRRAEPEYID